MSRLWARPVVANVDRLTTHDVVALWRAAARRGPYPTEAACEAQAAGLNDLIWHAADRARARSNAPAVAAGRLLLRAVSSLLAPFEAVNRGPKAWEGAETIAEPALLSVDDCSVLIAGRLAIVEILSVLDPFNFRLTQEQAVWFGANANGGRERLERLRQRAAHRTSQPWEATAIVCWVLARDALSQLGRRVGTTEESVAVAFTAKAVARLGFPAVTPRAVANRLRTLEALTVG